MNEHSYEESLGKPRFDRSVCVVIPMYNESSVIAGVLETVFSKFQSVICVDDGSTDASAVIADELGATVVRHPLNLGQGAALRSGMELALNRPDMQYIVTLDADGQHCAEDAARMLAVCQSENVDIVLGSRFLDSAHHIPTTRRALLRAAARFTRLTTRLALTDAHNGLRVMNRDAAWRLKPQQPGMAHASEMISAIARHRLRWQEVPVTIAYTEYSRAKGQSNLNAINVLHELFTARLRATS